MGAISLTIDPYVRLGTVQYMKDTVRMTSQLGGAIFCIVPSTVGKLEPMAPPEQEWAWAVEGLRQVLDVAQSLDVRIRGCRAAQPFRDLLH